MQLIGAIVAASTFVSAAAIAEDAAYTLVGTIISHSLAGAVLKNSQGEQTLYLLHERLPDGSQIIGVAKNTIRLRKSDNSEFDLFILHGLNAAAPANTVAPAVQPAPKSIAPSITEKPQLIEPQAPQPQRHRQRSARSNEARDE